MKLHRQDELADAASSSRTTVCAWEAGTIPRSANLSEVAAVLLTTVPWLIHGLEPKEAPIVPTTVPGRVRQAMAALGWQPFELTHAMAKRLPHWNTTYTLRFLGGLLAPTDDDLDALALALNLSPSLLIEVPEHATSSQSLPTDEHAFLAEALAICDTLGAARPSPWTSVEKTNAMLHISKLLSDLDEAARGKLREIHRTLLR